MEEKEVKMEVSFLEKIEGLFDAKNYTEVIRIILNFIENGGKNPEICNYFIMSVRLISNPKDYIELAKKLVQEYEGSSELFAIHMQHSLGRLLYETGEYIEANSNFMLANCRYNPDHHQHRANNLYYYAISLKEQGNIDSALQVMNQTVNLWKKVLRNDPEDISFLLGLLNAQKLQEEIHSKS